RGYSKRDGHGGEALPTNGHDCDEQQDRRHRYDDAIGIGNDVIRSPAVVSCRNPEQRADGDVNCAREATDDECSPTSSQSLHEDVLTERISPEKVAAVETIGFCQQMISKR